VKRLIVGALAAGLAFGVGTGIASAVTGFQTIGQFMGEPVAYRLGYIAGVSDTLTALGDNTVDANSAMSYVRTAAGCVTNRQMVLNQLESFLVTQMPPGVNYNQAASVFVATLSNCPY